MATAKENKHALAEQDLRGPVLNPVGGAEFQEADKIPTNDEPPIPLAPAEYDDRMFSFEADGQRTASPRTIFPPLPQAQEVTPGRLLTQDDLNSVAYQCLNSSAQMNAESMILRPGDRVAGAVDVFPINNVDDDARISLMPGAAVPEDAPGFFPAHYMVESKRLARGKRSSR